MATEAIASSPSGGRRPLTPVQQQAMAAAAVGLLSEPPVDRKARLRMELLELLAVRQGWSDQLPLL